MTTAAPPSNLVPTETNGMPRCSRRSGRGSSCRGSTRMTESTRRCAHQDWCTSSSSEMLSTICSTSDWLCAVSTDSTPTMNWK